MIKILFIYERTFQGGYLKVNKKIISAALAAALALSSATLHVSAVKFIKEDGLTYSVEDGEKVLYTGWTRDKKTGGRKYYRNGKRVVGWAAINGEKYYLLKTGGVAVGNYKIGGTVYVFSYKGVYSGESYSEGYIYHADTYGRIMCNTTIIESKKYGEVYGGAKSTDGSANRITVGLTDEKYADVFKGFASEPDLITIEKVKYSLNDLTALQDFVMDNCSRNEKYNVIGAGIGYNTVNIVVSTEDNRAAVKEFLDDNGYESDMYEIEIGEPAILE